MKHYEDHPLADLFPLLGDDELQEMADSITDDGLDNPVALYEGKILDGRNRYRACVLAGVEPEFVQYKGKHPLKYVIKQNLRRRRLTESQLAMVGAELTTTSHGGDRSKGSQGLLTIAEASKITGASETSIKRALRLKKGSSKKVIKAIKSGKSTVVTELKAAEAKEQEKLRPSTLNAVFDELNHELPELITEDWARATKAREYMTMLTKVKSYVTAGIELNDPIFREVSQDLVAHLTNAFRQLKQVVPYSICVSCQGHRRKGCDFCKGRGFMSEFLYKTCVPSDIKKMREPAAK